MPRDLEGRVAIVTGGGARIGLATAPAPAPDGAVVPLPGRGPPPGRGGAAGGAGRGGGGRAVRMDVTDARSVADAFAEIDGAGRLDIVVNNAGMDLVGRVEELSEKDWDACLDTNLKGPFLVAREAIPRLRATGGGVIVNVA